MVSQTTVRSGDDRPDVFVATAKDVFKACVGASPTKTQGVYFFINCDPFSMAFNEIDSVDLSTQPPTRLATVGSITFEDPLIDSTKGMIRKTAKVPVSITIDCNNTHTTTAVLHGIMSLKYSPLAPVNACVDSGKVSLVGSGSSNLPGVPATFIVDNGSGITVKKRSPTITSFPSLP
jgi:hypothetical protein